MDGILNTVDPETGLTVLETLLGTLMSVIGVVLMTVITLVAAKLRTVLPEWMHSQIDEKNVQILHSAAMTIIRKILMEGGKPEDELRRILDYMKSSAKDAFLNALKNRTVGEVDEIFTDIALSKVPLGIAELGDAFKPIASAPTTRRVRPGTNS